ncbi:MAG: GNAT family N-acetyltransferase [Anaeromyxobacteraceae bacterium]
MPPFTFRPLTPDRWPDLERLFGPNGACEGCWCTFFRYPKPEWRTGKGEGNRARQRAYVDAGHVPGLLAYDGDAPVGWVAVEPREAYPVVLASRLTRPGPGREAGGTWAITCFYAPRASRGRGLMRALVDAAVAHARAGGAARVEAYPVDPDGRTDAGALYHGHARVFRAAGFRVLGRPSPARAIVVRELSAPRGRRAPARARARSTPRTRRSRSSPSRRSR